MVEVKTGRAAFASTQDSFVVGADEAEHPLLVMQTKL